MVLDKAQNGTNPLDVTESKILSFIGQRALQSMVIDYEEFQTLTQEQYHNRINCSLPATTEDIVRLTNMPSSTISDLLQRLRVRKKIKSRKVLWFSRELRLYIPYHFSWPKYISQTCGSCENWNRFTSSCTFLKELTSERFSVETVRLRAKLHAKFIACKWHLKRISPALFTFQTLQEFAVAASDTEIWNNNDDLNSFYLTDPKVPVIGYRCVTCKKPMPVFGWGMLPNVSSSLLTCKYCGTFYKLWYDKEGKVYQVKVAKEQYLEYSKNYQIFTGGKKPTPFASREEYGISLREVSEEHLLTNISMLAIDNIHAHFCQLDFLVVNSEEERQLLLEIVGADYPRIRFIVRGKPLESIEPTKQQLGAVGLLRETEELNIEYALALLKSRRTCLEQLEEFSERKAIDKAQEEINEALNKLLEIKRRGKTLPSEEWNRTDGLIAKHQWKVVKKTFEENKFDFPNRRKARHTERDPIRPYGSYFSFSKGNTIVNAAFGKIDREYILTCNEHSFPWNGLPGICHTKTTGGTYDFTLDHEESFKQTTLPTLVKAVANEIITPDMIQTVRLRKRIQQHFLYPGSEGDRRIEELSKQIMKEKVYTWMNGKEQQSSIKRTMDYQVLAVKRLLEDLCWNEKLHRSSEKKQYQAWTIGEKKKWEVLPWREQQAIRKAIQEVLQEAKGYFRPFSYRTEKEATEEFDFEL